MVDLAQALSEIKSLPDEALQRELSSPTGMVPGYLVLGEMHERKALRKSATTASQKKSLAEDYIGQKQEFDPYIFQKMQEQQQPPPQPVPPEAQGIGGLPAQAPQGYARGGIVSLRQLSQFRGGVDPRLMEILEAASANSPFEVQLKSGYREGDPRFHGKKMATDIQLVNRQTGEVLPDYQTPETFAQYEQYAREARRVQQQMYPELTGQFRWGGYFSGEKGKYGAMDLMHFDIGGSDNVGMAGGSWERGLNPEQAALWGVNLAENPATRGATTDYKRALLDTIAGPESAGKYNVRYGGGTFDKYDQHPNVRIPIMSGPNQGDYSTAAGRYQFIKGTWDDQAKKLGLKDFSPASQDAAAWNLATETYAQKTGRNLEADLASGDPTVVAGVGKTLSSQWTSLPGGIEQGVDQNAFVSAFNKNLGTPASDVAATGENTAATNTAAAATETAEPKKDFFTQYQAAMNLMNPQAQEPEMQIAAPTPMQAKPIDPLLYQKTSQTPGFYEDMMRRRRPNAFA